MFSFLPLLIPFFDGSSSFYCKKSSEKSQWILSSPRVFVCFVQFLVPVFVEFSDAVLKARRCYGFPDPCGPSGV
jgi:hypothetical protein